MAVGVFQSIMALASTCHRQVSRMSSKLLGTGSPRSIDGRTKIAPSWAPYLTRRIRLIPNFRTGDSPAEQKQKKKRRHKRAPEQQAEVEGEEEEFEDAEESDEEREKGDGVWNKTILMGEKCQPLDFSGVIYYDTEGRRLQQLPPRSPLRSPLPSFSFPVVVVSDKGGIH